MICTWPFDVVVVTAPTQRAATAYQGELEKLIRARASRGSRLPVIFALADPLGKRVGSGGGTLNALYHVQHVYGEIPVCTLIIHSGGDAQRCPPTSLCGKALCQLNTFSLTESGSCRPPIDLLFEQLAILFRQAPARSCVVASGDVLLSMPAAVPIPDWAEYAGVVGVACRGSIEVGANHGVYVAEEAVCTPGEVVPVRTYLQKVSVSELRLFKAVLPPRATATAPEEVALDTGIIYFAPSVTAALSSLLHEDPFRRCTDGGVQQGTHVLRLELYSDILLALRQTSAQPAARYLDQHQVPPDILQARQKLLALMEQWPFQVLTLHGGRFAHLGTTYELMQMLTLQVPAFAEAFSLRKQALCIVDVSVKDEGATVFNTIISCPGKVGKAAVVEHCCITGEDRKVCIGTGAFVSGLSLPAVENLSVRADMCLQQIRLGSSKLTTDKAECSTGSDPACFVLTLVAVDDPIKMQYLADGARVWQVPWNTLTTKLGIDKAALWSDAVPEGEKTLWNARLFPILPADEEKSAWMHCQWMQGVALGAEPEKHVVKAWVQSRRTSLSELLHLADPHLEFTWRRDLCQHIMQRRSQKRKRTLEQLCEGLLRNPANMHECDRVDKSWQQLADPAERCLLASEVEEWTHKHLHILPSAALTAALALLARLCQSVCSQLRPHQSEAEGLVECTPDITYDQVDPWEKMAPDSEPKVKQQRDFITKEVEPAIIQATGSMECQGHVWLNVAQRFQGKCWGRVREDVASAQANVKPRARPMPAFESILAEAPARIDFAGGWSDTPPLCYDLGGVVTCAAVKLNGKRPFACRVDRLEEPKLVLQARQVDNSVTEVCCNSLTDLEHIAPRSPLALSKCVVQYLGIVRTDICAASVADQLRDRLVCGLRICSSADLPLGCGLGASSILAGVILAAVAQVIGYEYDSSSLIHAVLVIEQMLGCGGGWQDQVGGLVGGVKIASSRASLPLQVDYRVAKISAVTRQLLHERVLLVFTGKQRLARNLLQGVLRRYWERCPEFMSNYQKLTVNASQAMEALEAGDIERLASCLNIYREHKKYMAGPDCEPAHLLRLLQAVESQALGMSLCGAGGGGFLVLITIDSVNEMQIAQLQTAIQQTHAEAFITRIEIDLQGISVQVT